MNLPDAFDLTGRKALITGASRGIGRAIALGLAGAGADVAVHYAGQTDAVGEVVQRIRALGRQATAVQADLAAPCAPAHLAETTLAEMGQVDILVLNVAVQIRQGWEAVTREAFDRQVTVNLRAPFELMQRLGPAMAQRGWGRIVSVGSVQERKPHAQMSVYAATKAAMQNLVCNLASELSPHGVTVNNLSPGVIETDRNADVLTDAATRQRVEHQVRTGFIGQPEDCVGAALLLCSDAGRYITGSTLSVEGGWTL